MFIAHRYLYLALSHSLAQCAFAIAIEMACVDQPLGNHPIHAFSIHMQEEFTTCGFVYVFSLSFAFFMDVNIWCSQTIKVNSLPPFCCLFDYLANGHIMSIDQNLSLQNVFKQSFIWRRKKIWKLILIGCHNVQF